MSSLLAQVQEGPYAYAKEEAEFDDLLSKLEDGVKKLAKPHAWGTGWSALTATNGNGAMTTNQALAQSQHQLEVQKQENEQPMNLLQVAMTAIEEPHALQKQQEVEAKGKIKQQMLEDIKQTQERRRKSTRVSKLADRLILGNKQAKAPEIMRVDCLLNSYKLQDMQARKKLFKGLLLKWHPDKNKDNEEVAAKVFRHLKAQEGQFLK